MLNRRIIRGKVLQQFYSYKTCVVANAELTQEKIIDHFKPDLNSTEPQDAKKLEGYGKLALIMFDEYLKTGKESKDPTVPVEISVFLSDIIRQYNAANKKDEARILAQMVNYAEALYEQYLKTLVHLVVLADKLLEIKKSSVLVKNKIIETLKQNPAFNSEITRLNVHWRHDQDLVSATLAQLMEDTEYKTYAASKEKSLEEDQKIILHVYKNVILKNPQVYDHFEGINLHWDEDKIAIKDMGVDTIKSINENGEMQLSTISKNWDDDKEFMKELFSNTVQNDRYYEEIIAPKLKNWDITRLTGTDSYLMQICISEMIHFPYIPVKVSINEYIELSKIFSTPKSKTLINGVLDTITQELTQTGVIKKSGRGLIDNK